MLERGGKRWGSGPLYLIVSKFKPTRFGSRKSLRLASHVPSPTYMVFELYVLLPGGERLSCGAIVSPQFRRSSSPLLPDGSASPFFRSLSVNGIRRYLPIDTVSRGMRLAESSRGT